MATNDSNLFQTIRAGEMGRQSVTGRDKGCDESGLDESSPYNESSPYGGGLPRRRNMRLRGYDYSQAGAYFVTVCAHGQRCLFGSVDEDGMRLNEVGTLVLQTWNEVAAFYPGVGIPALVVMPNHLHAVLLLAGGGEKLGAGEQKVAMNPDAMDPGAMNRAPTAGGEGCCAPLPVGEIVRGIKARCSRAANAQGWLGTGAQLWQRNYYEHIIRDQADYDRIAEYIENNPRQWAEDTLHPSYTPKRYDGQEK